MHSFPCHAKTFFGGIGIVGFAFGEAAVCLVTSLRRIPLAFFQLCRDSPF
jgi:hypothetical protein